MSAIRRALAVGLILAATAACSNAGNGDDDPANAPTPSPTTASATPTPTTASPTASVPAGLSEFYDQNPRWSGCEGDFECTTIKVPLDYDNPAAGSIDVNVIRLPASKPSQRLGSLLLNPGGPGGSGIDYARQARAVVSSAVRDRYDVVGFDPRGVATSTPVECLTDKETDTFIAMDGSPDSAAEEAALAEESRFFAGRCQQRSARLLPHVGTKDAARDMDVLRAVVGDEKLTYLGKSYGTYLGATYAELFPTRVGRLVLDGALDPRSTSDQINLEQAKGFERALQAFVDDCVSSRNCPVGRTRSGALTRIRSLLASVDARPLPSDDGRRVTQAMAVLGIAAALYDEQSGWPILRQALEEALDGDGTTLMLLADFYTERQSDGTYANNQNDVIYAVNCLDHPEKDSIAAIRQKQAAFVAAAPTFGSYLVWSGLPCTYWPVPPENAPHAITAPGAPPILVVGTLRDPATPYQWAVSLAGQLASGVLLTWNGDGHTAYQRGSSCVDQTVDAYLINGTVPVDGKRCN